MVDGRAGVLRGAGEAAHRVTFFELFFDLVYVFSITQLSHGLIEHVDLRGAAETLLLLLAVWWAWVYTTWATNWVNPDSTPVRLMLVGVMGAALVMAAALPDAFGDRGLQFALAYAVIQVGRSAFVLWAVRADPVRRSNFQRIVCWNAAASVIWIAGGLVEGNVRDLAWIVALLVDYAAPAARFWVPGLGRSRTEDWTVHGGYFTERFKLFVILALGESVLVTGITFSELVPDVATLTGLAVAFAGSVGLWWIYFHRSAEAGTGAVVRAADPGRLARSAYTYLHLPIVAGIIVTAVADELLIRHPTDVADGPTVAATVGGPALFLAGHALFTWATARAMSMVRLAAIGALAALVPLGFALPTLALGAAATVVVIALAAIESLRGPSAAAEGGEVLVEASDVGGQ